jgi:hypothetical protein
MNKNEIKKKIEGRMPILTKNRNNKIHGVFKNRSDYETVVDGMTDLFLELLNKK